tara:strand:- start:93714 stop:95654 length:1941 start_codon:yes stop_codon:yes gene_type:complete
MSDSGKFLKELEDSPDELLEYLNLALEGANLGIWDWNLTDNSVRFDRRWSEMLGLDHATVKMELNTWESRVHPDDLEKTYADVKAYMEGETPFYENIHRMKHADGHWVYILDRGRFSGWDSEGNPTRFTGTHFDITSSERYRKKLSLFFNDSPFGYAFCDMDGNLLEINERYAEILGYNLEELKKLSYWDITPRKFEEAEARQLESLKATGKYGPYRKEYIRKDGTIVPVELNGFLVEDYDGIDGIWSTVEDISEKKMLEDRLVHTSKLASIGTLAAGVGHEINNPLAIINLTAQKLMRLCSKDEELYNGLNQIKVSAKRIAKIVAGLRTFSKVDGGNFKPLNMNELIQDTLEHLKELTKEAKVEVEFKPEKEVLPFISGDMGKLQQVFVNLISNAKDATEGCDNRCVTICTKVDNNKVIALVSDSGVGMSSDVLKQVFDPFFTTKGVNKGTGIGLSISNNIVLDHGATIEVASQEGEGTTFTLKFPYLENQRENLPLDPIKNTESLIKDSPKVEGKIMLVEDEEQFSGLIKETLEGIGLEVHSYVDGRSAFDAFSSGERRFDLILSDVKMPRMDGIELLEKVRGQSAIPQPKFIFLTGGVNTDLSKLTGERAEQADDFLYKPVEVEDLEKKVLYALSLVEKKSAA